MALHALRENTGRVSGYASKIAGILGLCALTATCGNGKSEAESPVFQNIAEISEAEAVIDDNRADILRSLETEAQAQPGPAAVTEEQFRHAETKNGEKTGDEAMVLQQFGGHLFNMQRIPGMEECPTVMRKTKENSPTNVYMRFPETNDKEPRIIFFLHGNGGQNMKKKDTKNVIQFTKEMQEEGRPFILIAPQDGWGNFYPEGPKKKPGNWRDFNDANTFANLIGFAEGIVGKRVEDMTLATFSGGNIGVMKILRALEREKDDNPEAADLYARIRQVAYFDSATGEGADFVTRWMRSNPDNSAWNCYLRKGQYNQGNTVLFKTPLPQGISPEQIHSEAMKWGYEGHGIFREYYRRFIRRG